MSEQILLLNPRAKRKTKSRRRSRRRSGRMPAALRRYWATHRRSRHRKRRARRAYSRAHNPHRRRRHTGRHYRRAHNRRHTRRHSYARRHNRRSVRDMGRASILSAKGILQQYIIPMSIGGAGAVLLDIGWGYVQPKVPDALKGGWGALAAKLGIIVLATFGVKKFAPRYASHAHTAMLGAATVAGYVAIKGMAQSILPAGTPGLSGYIDYQSYALPGAHRMAGYMPRGGTLGGLADDMYSPAAVIQPPGTPVPRQFGRLGHLAGYVAVQPHVGGGGGIMGYDWSHDGM